MPTIRPAAPDDAAGIAAVHVAAWRSAYRDLMPRRVLDGLSVERRRSAWHRVLTLPTEDRILVAEEEGEVVGFAGVGWPQHPDDDLPGHAELLSIYVARPGQGTGRALLAAAEAEMRRRGAHTGLLWVLDGNTGACGFYEAAGWSPDGARRPHHVEGTELTVLRYVRALETQDQRTEDSRPQTGPQPGGSRSGV